MTGLKEAVLIGLIAIECKAFFADWANGVGHMIVGLKTKTQVGSYLVCG